MNNDNIIYFESDSKSITQGKQKNTTTQKWLVIVHYRVGVS